MGYMLITRNEELRNKAFIITSSLQLGLPQRLVQFSHRAHDASKRILDSLWAYLASTSVSSSRGAHTVSHNYLVDLICTIMTEAGVPTSCNMVPTGTILVDNQQGVEGYSEQGDAHITSHKKSPVVTNPPLGSYPKFSKYKEGYIWKGIMMAIIPAISSTTSAFGCDLLRI